MRPEPLPRAQRVASPGEGSADIAASSFNKHIGRAGALAVEAGRLAKHGDDLAELAEGQPVVVGRARLGELAAMVGELGPVDRPGLLDGCLPDAIGQLGELVDQCLVDRAVGRPIAVFFFRGERGRALSSGS